MNLRALMDRKNLNKNLVVVLLLTLLPTGFGPLPNANAVKASSLTSNSLEASCASTVSDSSTAKLDVIIDGNYCVLRFLSSTNTWTPPALTPTVEYLVVGGGGGGAGGRGGGGGAGGFLTGTVSSPATFSISVANGGAGAVNNSNGSNGETSTISYSGTSVSAVGGGGGGTSFTNAFTYPARSGASGGGAGVFGDNTLSNNDIGYAGGSGIAGQGFKGGSSGGKLSNDGIDKDYSYKGSCTDIPWDQIRNTAGGGGAGGPGIAGRGGSSPLRSPVTLTCQATVLPDGGPGLSSKITGAPMFYAAGGGGSAGRFNSTTENTYYWTAGPGAGGSGIGGTGSPIAGTNGGAGVANTGSGGGAGGVSRTSDTDKGICASASDLDESCDGGAGGSGVVILRFLAPNFHTDIQAQICPSGVTSVSSDSHTSSVIAGDCILSFFAPTENDTGTYLWQVPAGVTSILIVAVGGGGGGGNNAGGGGGGGQVVDSSTAPIRVYPGETYTLTIGIGGKHRTGYANDSVNQDGTGGTNGYQSGITGSNVNLGALGGGGASGSQNASDFQPNLTGWTRGGMGSCGLGCPTGYPVGGASRTAGAAWPEIGSGGGGSGGVGGNANPTNVSSNQLGGDGGAGQSVSILGSTKCLGGGGGGGTKSGAPTQSVATCGGGQGGISSSTLPSDGTPGTGGGGGGAGTENATKGGHGGSGLIIIRFTVPNPRGATNNLNLACHAFGTATNGDSSRSQNYFGTPFTTDTSTTEFTFESYGGASYSNNFGHDWGTLGPAGCVTKANTSFTTYIWGYIKNPTGLQNDFNFQYLVDDNIRFLVDGHLISDEASSNSGGPGLKSITNETITMTANSWHFVQLWTHSYSGSASVLIKYRTASNPSWTSFSSGYLSRYVPRTLATTSIPTSTRYNETLTVSMTVDTSSVVVGGVNDSATTMSSRGKFTFYDSQTALTGCTNVYSADGAFKCGWYVKPSALGLRTIKVVFTPDSSTGMTDLQYNVFRRVEWTQTIEVTKGRQSPLRIGQYTAFVGISSYPLNVYPDTSIYPKMGTTYTRSVTTGTAGCQLDPTRFFVTDTLADTSSGGSCVATVVLSGTELFAPETGTATIYFVKWSDAYATQVPSGAHTIPLSGGTQIIVHTETVTVTDTATAFRDLSNNVITSAAPGAEIRIYITGYAGLSASDLTVTFRVYEDATITAKTDTYVQILVPTTASSGVVAIDSPRGVSYTPSLTISP